MGRRQSFGHSMPDYCQQAKAKFSKYTLHPVCAKIPWMDKPEFLGLVEDINENGLLDPIIRHDGKIVDGKHRLASCLIAGVKPRFVDWDGQGSLVSWIVSKNVFRRHLTASQRAAIALDLLPLLEKEAKERQRKGGRVAKQCATLRDAGKASEYAAKLTGSNSRYVEAVKTIQKQAPELVDEIRSGNLTVPDASAVARLPKPQRKRILRSVERQRSLGQDG